VPFGAASGLSAHLPRPHPKTATAKLHLTRGEKVRTHKLVGGVSMSGEPARLIRSGGQIPVRPMSAMGGKRSSADIGINVKVALLPQERVYLQVWDAMIGTPWHL
jgi:hypothetical protein